MLAKGWSLLDDVWVAGHRFILNEARDLAAQAARVTGGR